MKSIDLFAFQHEIFEDNSRYKVISAGRRVGKSYLSCVEALHHCLQDERRVIIVGCSFGQIKEAIWSNLKSIIPQSYINKISESSLDIYFINKSRITLRGSDRPELLRGISPSPTMIICDEFAFFKSGTFQEVLQPMAIDPNRKANFMIISTPKGIGNEFHDLYLRGKDIDYPTWKSWEFTCVDARPDMKEEVDNARSSLDPKTFQQEYEASFINTGNTVFYEFNYKDHVDDKLKWFEDGEEVHIGIDFNVDIMASVIFSVRGDQMHLLSEYTNSKNTDELCRKIKKDFPNKRITTYPDPTGRARKTSSAVGITDLSILKQYQFHVVANRKNPMVIDSVNSVNRMLRDANGTIRMYIHPRCKKTIRSLSATQWKDGLISDDAKIDKTMGSEHWSDALRYATHELFPIRMGQMAVKRGFKF